jgi:gas vesicle protein
METLSYIVLILLSLAGYSAGVTSRAGRETEPEPRLLDIFLVLIIWTAAIFSRITFDLSKWIFFLFGVLAGFIIGFVVHWLVLPKDSSSPKKKASSSERENKIDKKNLWEKWKDFSKRMGGFQSRMLLSFIFFILIAPFALAVKIFSDPLNLKTQKGETHWQKRKALSQSLEDYKRQF